MPIVRNVKYAVKKDHNIYIANGDAYRGRSPLYNPFRLANYRDVYERKENLAQYKKYLWRRMRSDDPTVSEPIWKELRRIQDGSVLNCHCYPLPHCHGHGIIAAWQWAKEHGLLEPVYTNHSDDSTLKQIARSNEKALTPPHTAPGPLDMPALLERMRESLLADARIDEEILATQPVDLGYDSLVIPTPRNERDDLECQVHDFCHAPNHLMHSAPKKKRGRGAPVKRKGIVYTQPDPIYNEMDMVAADLADLYAVAS